jgi:lysophospholipid acyltransferase (LPLAT)-like uncharacterized protein
VKSDLKWWSATKSWVVRMVVTALCRTYRLTSVVGSERLEVVRSGREAVILCFWHNRIVYSTYHLYNELQLKRHPVKVLISRSRDGELIARVIEALGGETARGSTSRGGSRALRKLTRLLKKGPVAVVTTPDGPRGPVYRAQAGTVLLAQLSGAPVFPVSYSAEKTWRLRSWDRFMVPKPFSRISLVVGPSLRFARDQDEAGREQARLELEGALLATDGEAAAVFADQK